MGPPPATRTGSRSAGPCYQAMERNLGMAVEHKSTGKYDQESERVAQPAGFANGASRTEQPVRSLATLRRHGFLGVLRAVRADARSAVQSRLPSAGPARV